MFDWVRDHLSDLPEQEDAQDARGGTYFQPPCHIIARHFEWDGSVATVECGVSVSDDKGVTSFAVFTDRDAAEQFRDERFPDLLMFELSDFSTLRAVFTIAAKIGQRIAFDPYRKGKLCRISTPEECLRAIERMT